MRDKFGKISRSALFLQFNPGGGCSLKWILSILGLFALFLSTALPLGAVASPTNNSAAFNDGIDRTDPNFVKASLLIMSPGDALYSCAGHTCIRLECPKFNLDYCFSYESEGVSEKVLTFLRGKLKMGMFAVPTADYLKLGREEGRGVMQYTLNLPADAKQRLWKILDERVEQGAFLPYNYMSRGCAQSALNVIMEALHPYRLVVDPWPDKFLNWTRREFVRDATQGYWWQQMPMCALCGTESDIKTTKFQNVVVPLGLLEVLRIGKVNGTTVIDGDGEELLPVRHVAEDGLRLSSTLFAPLPVSLLVFLVALSNIFLKWVWIDDVFLAFQLLAGLLFTYLVVFSDLPSTGWNWLFVPFNILPFVFWKWRAKWALWFAGLLVLWEVGIILWPHFLTLPAYLVLVAAYIVMYARMGWPKKWMLARQKKPVEPLTRSCADIFEDLRRRNMERGRV